MTVVLVTGCNGNVGRYVTRALLGAGYRVVGLSVEQLSPTQHENFEYHRVDVTDAQAVAQLLKDAHPTAVVHLAALVHVRRQHLGFVDYCRMNYDASRRLFELSATHGAKKIVFSSTIEVYGATPDGSTVDEDYPCRPDSDYARTKLLAEAALQELRERHGVSVATLRLAPVYAPDFRLNLDKRLYLIPGYFYRIGSRDYQLDLCSVHNVEHFIIRWLSQDPSPSGVFNLCDGRSYPISELAAREAQARRARHGIRVPFWPAVAAAAGLETLMNFVGRSPGMYTANNIRKLVRSSHWDTSKAVSVVGPLPFDIENTMDQAV